MNNNPMETCGQCGNQHGIRVIDEHAERGEDEKQGAIHWETIWRIIVCPVCENETVIKRHWFSEWDEFEDHGDEGLYRIANYDYRVAYFTEIQDNRHLPEVLREEYQRTLQLRYKDANSCAKSIGLIIENLLKDQKAEPLRKDQKDNEGIVAKKINDLEVKGILSKDLAEIAKNLWKIRNIASHEALVNISVDDAKFLTELCKIILDHVYALPKMSSRVKGYSEALEQASKK